MNQAADKAFAHTPAAAREAAVAALAANDLSERSVRYRSAGRLLIVGPTDAALRCAERLDGLPMRVLLVDRTPSVPVPAGNQLFTATLERLEGHLGRFSVAVSALDRHHVDLAVLCAIPHFDLVLDLQPRPALTMPTLPPGYFAPGDDDEALEAALAALPELIGEFEKPQYVQYEPSHCLRGAGGKAGCDRCLRVCPAWAIRDLVTRVAIDFDRCHGVGSCATACPTGAIRYELPRPASLNGRVRDALRRYREACGDAPRLLFHASACPLDLPVDTLPVQLEEPAAAGAETWLAALAWGAAEVLLLPQPETATAALELLQREVATARHLLEGLGHDPDRLQMLPASDAETLGASLAARPHRAAPPAATFAAVPEKRGLIELALRHLVAHAPHPADVVPLPDGAPFGNVHLAAERCTLCMSCVGACKVGALVDGGDVPRLDFIEAHCVQCGLCREVCPESALTLEPRFLTSARREKRNLKQENPFHCIRCGTPFATRGVVERMVTQLANHPMFSDGRIERLQMCEECRVRAMFDESGQRAAG